jgi:outer membrane receptor protein involved in Fe transport
MTVAYWIDSFNDIQEGKWQSIVTSPDVFRTVMTNEMSAFAKDDWKISRNLTLNLGVRWEYYGAAYIREGFTATPVDQGLGVFGVSRGTSGGVFDSWLVPGANPVFLSGTDKTQRASTALQCTREWPRRICPRRAAIRKPDDNRVCWSRLSASGKNGCSQ